MDRDSRLMRGDRPFLFTNCMTGHNIEKLADWIIRDALFDVPLVPQVKSMPAEEIPFVNPEPRPADMAGEDAHA